MSYLEIHDVSKRMGPDLVLDGVGFSVERGQVVGLEGENGSGKTMAMRVALGLVRPSEGWVEVAGLRLWRDASFPPSVGLLIEGPALLGGYTALENLRMLASIRGVAGEGELRGALERVGLNPDDRRPCRAYSLGMRQRAGLALALMEAPELLVLDEPTNALDEESVAGLVTVLREERERGAAVLVSSHDADFLGAVCDEQVHLRLGRVVPSKA